MTLAIIPIRRRDAGRIDLPPVGTCRSALTLLNHQFPFGQKRRCPFLAQKANVGVSGRPSRWSELFRATFCKSRRDPRVHLWPIRDEDQHTSSSRSCHTHHLSPLARPDFQQRQFVLEAIRTVVVVSSSSRATAGKECGVATPTVGTASVVSVIPLLVRRLPVGTEVITQQADRWDGLCGDAPAP